MAAPTFINVMYVYGSGTSASADLSQMTLVTDDLLLVHVMRATCDELQDQYIAAPDGWHRIGSSHNGLVSAFFWKLRQTGDSNSVPFSWTVNNSYLILSYQFRGANKTQPICRHSIKRNDSDTWSWLAETAPVDCFALAVGVIDANRNGTTVPAGWNETFDFSAGGLVGVYAMYKPVVAAGVSTGAPSTKVGGTGIESLTQHMLLIQGPRALTPTRKIFARAGLVQAPSAPSTRDYTGLGFKVKAIILYSAQAPSSVTPNIEFMHGIAADDGVNAPNQKAVGVWHTSGGTSIAGWSSNGAVIKGYAQANSTLASPTFAATFTPIDDGFRLVWTKTINSYYFNYIAFGGDDLQVACGTCTSAASAVNTLPWRPDLIHAIGQCHNVDVDQIRTGAGVGALSIGWIDPNAGAQWAAALNIDGALPIRDNSFYTQNTAAAFTYDFQFGQALPNGWSWDGTNADLFFYLAFYWGNSGIQPVQLDVLRTNASGTANFIQPLPSLGHPSIAIAKSVISAVTGQNLTTPGSGQPCDFCEGGTGYAHGTRAISSNLPVAQGSYAFLRNINASERRRDAPQGGIICTAGSGLDLDVPKRSAAVQTDRDSIRWWSNDTVAQLFGLFSFGYVGVAYSITTLTDTFSLTESMKRVLTCVRNAADNETVDDALVVLFTIGVIPRSAVDAVSVDDFVQRALTYGRRLATDPVAVADLVRRTVVYGRRPTDTAAVADLVRRTLTYGRRPATDTATIADVLARVGWFARRAADTVSVFEQPVRDTVSERAAGDSASIVDELWRTATFARSQTDATPVTDAIEVARIATIEREASDTASAVDTLVRVTLFERLTTDVTSIVDALAILQAGAYERTESDATTVADTIVGSMAFDRSAADTAAVNDEVEASRAESQVTVSDTANVEDLLACAATSERAFVDVVEVVDALALASAQVVITSDVVVLADSVGVERASQTTFDDVVSALDQVEVKVAFGRVFADTVSVVDQGSIGVDFAGLDSVAVVDALSIAASYVVRLEDIVVVDDLIRVGRDSIKEAITSDGVTLDDLLSVTATRSIAQTVVDAVVALDLVTREHDSARAFLDVVAVTDRFGLGAAQVFGVSDTIAVVDSVTGALVLGRDVRDLTDVADVIAMGLDAGRVVRDTALTVDGVLVDLAVVVVVVDSVEVLDAIGAQKAFGRSLDDAVEALDFVSVGVDRDVFTDDAVEAVDLVALALAYARAALDAVDAFSDELILEQINVIVEFEDAVRVLDSLKTSVGVGKSLSDVVTVADVSTAARTLGGDAADTVEVEDLAAAEILKLGTEVVTTNDALGVTVWYSRSEDDFGLVEDAAHTGDVELVAHGIVDGANTGPIDMFTVLASPTAPATGSFTVEVGDLVGVADRMNSGAGFEDLEAISDNVSVEDSLHTAAVELVAHGIGHGANAGPVVVLTVEGGPLSLSGGPELSPGSGGFVVKRGDFVVATDILNASVGLAVQVNDSTEVMGYASADTR